MSTADQIDCALAILGVVAGIITLAVTGYFWLFAETTQEDYRQYLNSCEDHLGEEFVYHDGDRVVEVQYNESTVARCQNMTFAEYRQMRLDTALSAPLSTRDAVLFGAGGLGILLFGALAMRDQMETEVADVGE